jgi:hypothetical protein
MSTRLCSSPRIPKRLAGGKRHTRTDAASQYGEIRRYAANTAGQMGLIPQNYVQPIETEQPAGGEVPSAYENPTSDVSEFDMFQNNDYVTLTPVTAVNFPPEPQPNVYEDVSYSNDDWSGFEQSLASPPTMPVSHVLLRTVTTASHLLLAIER